MRQESKAPDLTFASSASQTEQENSPETSPESIPETIQMRTGAPCEWPVSRRDFVKGAGILLGAASLPPVLTGAETAPGAQTHHVPITLTINGQRRAITVDTRTSLLDLLRENLALTGTKKGCDHGQCGACTVLADGQRIVSCLSLAVSHDGEEVTTIEGLAQGEALASMQQAFLEHDGFQCGYCTPGQILSAVGLMSEAKRGAPSYITADLTNEGPVDLTAHEARERMSGNICRCGAYPGIVAAVRQCYGHSADEQS